MPRTRPVKSTAATQAKLETMLLQKRAELASKLREEREGRLGGAPQREKIEGSPFGDRPGLSPDDEMGFVVADRRAAMLSQIDFELTKMEEGTYGRCETCEEEIAFARLRAQPFAVRCSRCQEAWERDRARLETAGMRGRGPADEAI